MGPSRVHLMQPTSHAADIACRHHYADGSSRAGAGMRYADDPTILSWQLANEPRAIKERASFKKWMKDTASLIK